MIEPVGINIYRNRAGLNAKPSGYVDAEQVAALRLLLRRLRAEATVRNTFYNDISVYQKVVDHSYPYNILATRIDSGWGTDDHWHANAAVVRPWRQIKVWPNYMVCIPSENKKILARVKNTIGTKVPDKLVFTVDMESGSGFAGPGDHSAAGNWLADELADYAGSRKRVQPYANHWDYVDCWPNMADWLKPRQKTAAYGTNDPGTFAWQYYGGVDYGHVAGYPISNKTFGSWVDYNVIHKPIGQVMVDFGIAKKDWSDMATEKQIEALIDQKITANNATLEAQLKTAFGNDVSDAFHAFAHGGPVGEWHVSDHPHWLKHAGHGALDRLLKLENLYLQLKDKIK